MSLHVKESDSCSDLTATVDALLNRMYPIGIIIQLMVTDNPGTLFGIGTWTQIAKGRTLVGVDQDHELTEVPAGATYKENLQMGSYSTTHNHTISPHTHTVNSHTHSTSNHTLTVNEIPSHSHGLNPYVASWPSGQSNNFTFDNWHVGYPSLREIKTTSSAGGGAGHNHGNTGSSSPGTSSAGGGYTGSSGISVMQPYLTCYIWQRTA